MVFNAGYSAGVVVPPDHVEAAFNSAMVSVVPGTIPLAPLVPRIAWICFKTLASLSIEPRGTVKVAINVPFLPLCLAGTTLPLAMLNAIASVAGGLLTCNIRLAVRMSLGPALVNLTVRVTVPHSLINFSLAPHRCRCKGEATPQ
jgi:hypothetical protein